MNELEFRCIGSPLPMFCARCGLVEDHEVHHGRGAEWAGEKVAAHKFKLNPERREQRGDNF